MTHRLIKKKQTKNKKHPAKSTALFLADWDFIKLSKVEEIAEKTRIRTSTCVWSLNKYNLRKLYPLMRSKLLAKLAC